MERIAKLIEKTSQQYLPDVPHHLSDSTSRRFPATVKFWFEGPSSGLQYMTYISNADRGLLLTRPSYDIRDDPAMKSQLNSISGTPTRDGKKAVNKMSFKDYQRKKNSSMSPGGAEITPQAESRLAGSKDVLNQNRNAATNCETTRDGSGGVSRPNHNLQRKPAAEETEIQRPGAIVRPDASRSSASETRKRTAEADEMPRTNKRPKPSNVSETSRSRSVDVSRPLSPARTGPQKERPQGLLTDLKASEPRKLKPPVDKRSSEGKTKQGAGYSPSPQPEIQVNGSRVFGEERRPKPTVPPLLSPLRLDLDEKEQARLNVKRQSTGDADDRRRQGHVRNASSGTRPAKKPPLHIPPLLSPTLPGIIEAELALRRTPQKDDVVSDQSLPSKTSSSLLKPTSSSKVHGTADRVTKRSRIVVLKYKKKIAHRVKALLNLPPKGPGKSRRDALKERSVSVEATSRAAATKRPAQATAGSGSAMLAGGSKHDAAPSSWARPARPATPTRNSAAAMSRATSSTSQAHTPGQSAMRTPDVADSQPSSLGHHNDAYEPGEDASRKSLDERHRILSQLGTKIKHLRDDIARAGRAVNGTSTSSIPPADEKQVAILSLEMILAYMIAFYSLNKARSLEKKAPKFDMWETLLPHFEETRRSTRHSFALRRLALQLYALTLEELGQCYSSHNSEEVAMKMSKGFTRRREIWLETQERGLVGQIAQDLRDDTLGPWTSVPDAVRKSLRILRRWADREGVVWTAQLSLALANGA